MTTQPQFQSTTESPTDLTVQRTLVLASLRKRPHSTLELRDLGICSPAPRVQELREQGYEIKTSFAYQYDNAGVKHRIGVYTLIEEPN